MASINTAELSYLLSSRLAIYAANHNPEMERQRLIDYARMIDKFIANPSVFSGLDGLPADAPDQARQVKKAKFELNPPRMNNENSAPNPRVIPSIRNMSPIAENRTNINGSPQSETIVNPPSGHKTDQIVQSMTVVKLRKELKKRGKETNGLKRDLQCRLKQVIRETRRAEQAVHYNAVAHQELPRTTPDSDPNEVVEKNASVVEPTHPKVSTAQTEDNKQNEEPEQELCMQTEAVHIFDVDMVQAPGAKSEAKSDVANTMNCEANALEPVDTSKHSPMDVELNPSTVGRSLEKPPIPKISILENESDVDFVNRVQKASSYTIKDSLSGRDSDGMDCEPNIESIAAPRSTPFKTCSSPQCGPSSKVSDLAEMACCLTKTKSESAISRTKAAFPADQQAPSSPIASKPDEDEKSKQVLLSLKKLRENHTENKPETVAASAYKISSLAEVRMEQKASLKVNNPADSFLVNSTKLAPLGMSTTSKMAADKARLAEMRGKSKPAVLTKPIEAPSHLAKAMASFKSKAVSTIDFADQKKKQLAAQMRQKTAAKKNDRGEPLPQQKEAYDAACANKDAGETLSKAPIATKPVTKNKTLAEVVRALPGQQKSTPTTQKTVQGPGAPSSKKKTPSQNHRRDDIISPTSNYEISDREYSDSEDEESDDANEDNQKDIPKWARKENLEPALMKQYHDNRLDPDEIFNHGISTCDLEAIFEKKKSKFRKRTSSGNWTRDRVTPAEQLAYKRTMGYKPTK